MSDETTLRFQFESGFDEVTGKVVFEFGRYVTVLLVHPRVVLQSKLIENLVSHAMMAPPGLERLEEVKESIDRITYIDSRDNIVIHLPVPKQQWLLSHDQALYLSERLVALARAINGERTAIHASAR